jgi:hypothetical protein
MRKFISFLILTFCMLALLSVVASAESKTVELLAGQFIDDAGTVTVSYEDGELCVTYDTENGWRLVETHFAIAESPGDIPQNKNGNPKVGHFPYGDDELGEYDGDVNLIGGEVDYEECIELELEPGNHIIIIAAHASLLNLDEIIGYVEDPELEPGELGVPIYQQETGWGDGLEFVDGKNWAMYFEFTVVVEEE